MADSDRLKLTADLTRHALADELSSGLSLISEARRRFWPFRREDAAGYRLGDDLRITRIDASPEREDLPRLIVIESLSPAGEAFLREWEPQIVAAMRALTAWIEGGDSLDEIDAWPMEFFAEHPSERD